MNAIPAGSLTDLVYESIKQDILNREYAFGDKLTVRLLCEKYEVSETPVKLALNRLVSEKLVEALPRRGIRVSEFDLHEFRELMETRRMMELWCAEEMHKKAMEDASFPAMVRGRMEDCRSAILRYHEGEVRYDAVVEADFEFHKALMKATENHVLYDLYATLCDRLVLYCIWSQGYRDTQGYVEKAHDAIFAELLSGNAKKLRQRLDRHIDEAVSWL